jgi:hypothetical protein
MNESLTNLILAEINDLNESDLILLNNLYCDSINAPDSIIYSNDQEFFDMLNWSGLRVAQAIFYGDYTYSNAWVTFDGYGNFKTYHYFTTEELVELPKVMAEYIADNYNEFESLFSSEVDKLAYELN